MLRSLFALLIALSVPTAFAAEVDFYLASTAGTVTVAADGSVADVDLGDGGALGIPVIEFCESQIRTWRFAPPVESGRTVQVVAHLRLSLVAMRERGEDDTTLVIRDVSFLDAPEGRGRAATRPGLRSMRTPVYPTRAGSVGAGAEILLLAELGEGGQVVRVGTEHVVMLGKPQGRRAQIIADALSEAAEAAAADWRIEGFPPGAKVRVPVVFNTVREGWQRVHPFDAEPDPWVLATLAQGDVTELAATGERLSRLQLLSPLPAIPGLDAVD
jgi:hypothetical protein